MPALLELRVVAPRRAGRPSAHSCRSCLLDSGLCTAWSSFVRASSLASCNRVRCVTVTVVIHLTYGDAYTSLSNAHVGHAGFYPHHHIAAFVGVEAHFRGTSDHVIISDVGVLTAADSETAAGVDFSLLVPLCHPPSRSIVLANGAMEVGPTLAVLPLLARLLPS